MGKPETNYYGKTPKTPQPQENQNRLQREYPKDTTTNYSTYRKFHNDSRKQLHQRTNYCESTTQPKTTGNTTAPVHQPVKGSKSVHMPTGFRRLLNICQYVLPMY
ncbi:hypothetical protein CVS40_0690 [Lucilia cuprina]|nr:hypothetical protein CVS40_0690 [Lucilia cuprina]